MRVQCIHRQGDRIPHELVALGITPDSVFPVKHGKEYIVYAMALWGEVVHYLIVDDDEGSRRPDWIPAHLFQVSDPRLPSSWYYLYRNGDAYDIRAVWGYEEIAASDGKHYDGLSEREPEDLQIFERRRLEMDQDASELR